MVIGFDTSRSFTKDRTGTETYSYHLLKELLKIDRENVYRLYLRHTPNPSELKDVVAKVEQKLIILPRLWTQVGLATEVLENPPDLLFIPAHTLPVLHRPSLKSVVTIHDLGAEYLPQYHQFPQKLYLNRSTEYAVKHATRLIAVSEATKQDLIKRLQADPKKITVVHEAYDNERFVPQEKPKIQEVSKKYGIEGAYLLFVGTIQPRKNLERLIEAFGRVAQGFGKGSTLNQKAASEGRTLTLVLVGKKGWLSEAIYEAPNRFGVQDRVQFIDYVTADDLPALYSGAQAFVFPSLFEGFGIPILEAMACGTPVITSKISSMPEVAGEAALYVDPNDTNSITDALMCIGQEGVRATLIQKGFEQAKRFSWQKTARQTLEVFNEVYKSSGSSSNE